MKQYKTYIFDFDGTIADTATTWLGIFRDNLEEHGVAAPDDQTIARHTHDWRQTIELGLPESKLGSFTARAYELANERLPKTPLHNGAGEMLERLVNGGHAVAIFSGMDRVIFQPALEYRNMHTLVPITIAGDDVSHRKPHPAGIIKALQLLGISEDEYKNAVYIGDKDTDIIAARNAGIDGVLYYPATHQLLYDLDELSRHKPTAIITDWREL